MMLLTCRWTGLILMQWLQCQCQQQDQQHSNGNNSGVPTKKAAQEHKFTLRKEGKVHITFTSMVLKITNLIQRTFEGGSFVAKSLNDMKLCIISEPIMVYAAEDIVDVL
jgi:hypothetical protein